MQQPIKKFISLKFKGAMISFPYLITGDPRIDNLEKSRARNRAVGYIDSIIERHIGTLFEIFDGKRPTHTAFRKYSFKSDVWKAVPNTEDIKALYAGIIEQAVYDATGGKSHGKTSQDCLTAREKDPALKYLRSKKFEIDCEIAGLDFEAGRQAIARML